MRRLKTVRRPPIYPKTPGHLPCSSLTHPLPLSSRRPSVSFGGFGLTRFREVTGWSKDLRPELVVEAGCGAGRFTQIALETGAEVFSFDLTNAVDANQENNGQSQNLSLFQADLYHIPLKCETFDKIFCFGTLQHCPDPRTAFLSLLPYLKSGGEVVIDVYRTRLFRSILLPKSWILRERIPALGRVAGAFIPVPNPESTEGRPWGRVLEEADVPAVLVLTPVDRFQTHQPHQPSGSPDSPVAAARPSSLEVDRGSSNTDGPSGPSTPGPVGTGR